MKRKGRSSKTKKPKQKANIKYDTKPLPETGTPKDIRHWMTPLWILSGVAFGLAGVLCGISVSHYKFHALWMAAIGTGLAVAAVFVWLHTTIADHDRTPPPPGKLDNPTPAPLETTPSPTPASPDFPAFDVSVTQYIIKLGGFYTESWPPNALRVPKALGFSISGVKPVTVYTDGQHFFADVTLKGVPGNIQIQIKKNVLSGQPPDWDTNSSKRAFEVVDEKEQPVFQMVYKSKSHIVINGVFLWAGRVNIVSEQRLLQGVSPTDTAKIQEERSKIVRIFKYPSWKYPGQLAEAVESPILTPPPTPTPSPMKEDDRSNQSITTHGQTGGQNIIAGGDVNLGPPQRVVPPAQSSSMTRILSTAPKGRLDVMAVNADSETLAFAKQIHALLSAAGYNVGDRVSTMMWAGDPLPSMAFAVPGREMNEFTSAVFSALWQLDPKTVLWGNPHEPPTVMVCPRQ